MPRANQVAIHRVWRVSLDENGKEVPTGLGPPEFVTATHAANLVFLREAIYVGEPNGWRQP